MKRKIDIVVLSDLHLGMRNSSTKTLLNYLKSIKPNILILTGNILNIKNLKHLSADQLKIINRFLKLLANGTRIYYLTGETDAALRRFSDFSCGNFFLRDQLLLQLGDKRYWFLNGDTYMKQISFLESCGHNLKQFFGFKTNTKDFEKQLIAQTKLQGYNAVVCGYSKSPKMVEQDGIYYMNCGDWVENQTALEYEFGAWRLYKYDADDFELTNPKLTVYQEDLEDSPFTHSYPTHCKILKPIKDYVLVEDKIEAKTPWDGIEY
jgi:UDP-2,3-diacylglucosamine pyrophosphatase LpxH